MIRARVWNSAAKAIQGGGRTGPNFLAEIFGAPAETSTAERFSRDPSFERLKFLVRRTAQH